MNPIISFISVPFKTLIACPDCKGQGEVFVPVANWQPAEAKFCHSCEGTGQVLICTRCGARLGYVRRGRSCGCASLAMKEAA